MRRLRRSVRLTALAAVAWGLAVHSAQAQAPAALEEVLRRNLANREVQTRVPLGPPVTYRETVVARTITRQVVTDIEADGSINYVMPMMYVPLLPKKEIALSELSEVIAAGSRVRVGEITLGRRNVVIGVTELSRGAPSTVRLRLGKKYQERVSGSEMLRLLARAFVLPMYERSGELEREYSDLRSSIQAAEGRFAAAGRENQRKLESGRELKAALDAALANRRELGGLGNDVGAAEQEISQRLAELAPELEALERAAGRDRVSAIGRELEAIAAEEESISAEISGSKARSNSDLERLRGRLARWEELAARRGELHRQLAELGREVPAAEADRVAQSAKRLKDARGRLQSADRGVQVGSAVSQLQRLHDQAPQLRADLMALELSMAGDLSRIEAKVREFRKSIDERRRLSRRLDSLGRKVSDPVLLRIEDDQAELDRFQSVLAAERGSAEVRELDRAYQELETEFLEILDAYTLAFDTPQQLSEARRLVSHLGKMADNRKAASNAGSAQAGSDLRSLEAQIADLKRQNPKLR